MTVQRAGDDHSVDLRHVEQPAMVGERLDCGKILPDLVESPRVDVGDRDELRVRIRSVHEFPQLLEQLLPPRARPDDAGADTVVGPENPPVGGKGVRCRRQGPNRRARRSAQKLSASDTRCRHGGRLQACPQSRLGLVVASVVRIARAVRSEWSARWRRSSR